MSTDALLCMHANGVGMCACTCRNAWRYLLSLWYCLRWPTGATILDFICMLRLKPRTQTLTQNYISILRLKPRTQTQTQNSNFNPELHFHTQHFTDWVAINDDIYGLSGRTCRPEFWGVVTGSMFRCIVVESDSPLCTKPQLLYRLNTTHTL